jgi:hypothetical protein
MPKSVNKVILVGDVGKDPEVRYSQTGTPVANFSLATNERFKDRNDEWQERTEWTASFGRRNRGEPNRIPITVWLEMALRWSGPLGAEIKSRTGSSRTKDTGVS